MPIRVIRGNIYVLLMVFAVENILFMLYFFKLDTITVNKSVVNINYKVLQTKIVGAQVHRSLYDTRINSTWLEHHPIYKKLYIEEANEKEIVTILVIVSSAPKRLDRRNAIRETWWTQCVITKKVIPACIFMTDYQGPNDQYFHAVREEEKEYKDLHFQLVNGGVTFGKRFINHMLFAVKKYEFDYFLRVDDDFFICFENFLSQIPTPSLHFFHWGWVHRHAPIGLRRAEESLILLSRDVIETFLLQDPMKMLCHPWADQMIAVWLSSMNITTLLRHDDRIHHHPPVNEVPEILYKEDICDTYIAIHGAYPEEMKQLWKQRGINLTIEGNLTTYSIIFPVYEAFDWRLFDRHIWRYKPKLCIKDPKWDTSKQMDSENLYTGREDVRSINDNYEDYTEEDNNSNNVNQEFEADAEADRELEDKLSDAVNRKFVANVKNNRQTKDKLIDTVNKKFVAGGKAIPVSEDKDDDEEEDTADSLRKETEKILNNNHVTADDLDDNEEDSTDETGIEYLPDLEDNANIEDFL